MQNWLAVIQRVQSETDKKGGYSVYCVHASGIGRSLNSIPRTATLWTTRKDLKLVTEKFKW